MAPTTASMPSSYYRPRKLPRVIRRQWPLVLICSLILIGGGGAAGIVWRNLRYERLKLDQGLNQTSIEQMRKELLHIRSQIESESAYPRVAAWANWKHGWKPIVGRESEVSVPLSSLSVSAQQDVKCRNGWMHD